jgi:hypothetical protein
MPLSLSYLARQQFLWNGLISNDSYLATANAANNTQNMHIFLFSTALVGNLPADLVRLLVKGYTPFVHIVFIL